MLSWWCRQHHLKHFWGRPSITSVNIFISNKYWLCQVWKNITKLHVTTWDENRVHSSFANNKFWMQLRIFVNDIIFKNQNRIPKLQVLFKGSGVGGGGYTVVINMTERNQDSFLPPWLYKCREVIRLTCWPVKTSWLQQIKYAVYHFISWWCKYRSILV